MTSTAQTMKAAPAIARAPRRSSRMAHPSTTATTGFTYATVDSRAGVVALTSQPKALNATNDPKIVRYTSASALSVVTPVRATTPGSPRAALMSNIATPPVSICCAAAMTGCAFSAP